MALVLVIDDNAQMRRLARRILSSAGHSVLEAEDGERGMVLLCKERPSLVITDLVMPNKEGLETIREIREISPELKVIAMSGGDLGSGGKLYLHLAEQLGADAILAKPFRASELLNTVTRTLAGN